MNPNEPLPQPQAEPRADRHLHILAELADMAMALACAANAKAIRQIEATGEATPEAINHFTRLATAVRQAIALEDKLARNPAPRHAPTHRAPNPLPAPEPQCDPIASAPSAAANARPAPPDTRHRDERLDADNLSYEPDIDRPLEDILADLAKDLGLPPTFTEATPFSFTPSPLRQPKPTPRTWIARSPLHTPKSKTQIPHHTHPGLPPPPPD